MHGATAGVMTENQREKDMECEMEIGIEGFGVGSEKPKLETCSILCFRITSYIWITVRLCSTPISLISGFVGSISIVFLSEQKAFLLASIYTQKYVE